MNLYEVTYISTEEKGNDIAKAIFDSFDAEITNHQDLGKRKLAYKINKETQANYFCDLIKIDGENVGKLEKKLNQNDKILRALILRKSETTVENVLPSIEVKSTEIIKENKETEIIPIKEVKKEETKKTEAEEKVEKVLEKGNKKTVAKEEKKAETVDEAKEKKDKVKKEAEEEKERLEKLEEKLDQLLKD
ncbi:MAG: 30S ribosomal protein S6 [Patescibacteria group bacterium]